jgi:hypothetical protein
MQSTQFRIRNEGQGRKGRDCPDRLLAFADEVTERRLQQCISPFMAQSGEGQGANLRQLLGEQRNVAIEYRFAGNRNERLPALAADLVHRLKMAPTIEGQGPQL